MSFLPEPTANEVKRAGGGVEALLAILRTIERHQGEVNAATVARQQLLRTDAALRQLWDRFQAVGGISADDLGKFVQGRFRHRRIRESGHLRMIADNKWSFRKLHVERDDDDAA
jgi:hypothetical protein